jgi:non-ribosomal peptide synthetase component F
MITRGNARETLKTMRQALPQLTPLITLDQADRAALTNLDRRTTAQNPAYSIFTSGSTGVPKGVVAHHQPIINLIEWVNCEFAITPADRGLFITSVCFDLSVYDIFGLLAAGASLQIASNDQTQDPYALLKLIQTPPITFWNSAPPTLQQLVPRLKRRRSKRRDRPGEFPIDPSH